jgi:hypothetical protein
MSLTSYRAAPPRDGGGCERVGGIGGPGGDLLFRRLSGSTMGAEGFHGRVRDGIGCLAPRYGHQAGKAPRGWAPLRCARSRKVEKCLGACPRAGGGLALHAGGGAARRGRAGDQVDRAISTGQLHGLPRFHLRPIDVVVYHGSWRDLVLRRVSRLDAFSGYPVRT